MDAAARIVAAWRNKSKRTAHQRALRDSYLTGQQLTAHSLGAIELDFAYFMPRLFELPHEQQVRCLQMLIANQTRYSVTLLNSFQVIWSHRPVQKDILELVARSINSFPINSAVSFSHLSPLIDLLAEIGSLPQPITELLQVTITQHPSETLCELLIKPCSVSHFSDEMLEPLVHINAPPQVDPSCLNAWPLAVRLLENPQKSFPLLAVVMGTLPAGEIPLQYQEELAKLCNHEFVSSLVSALSPINLSTFFLKLIDVIPDAKSELLLHLTLASSPSPLQALWREFTATRLYQDVVTIPTKPIEESDACDVLRLILELYSYWLMVAIDTDLFDPVRGLKREDFTDLCTVARNASFSILLNDSNLALREILLTTLRQLYTKNTRREFLPGDFWLMEKHMESYLGSGASAKIAPEVLNGLISEGSVKVSSPTARILLHAPFFIRFRSRAEWFSRFVKDDREHHLSFDQVSRGGNLIRREALCEDAMEVYESADLRNLRITLMSNGEPEAGIDGGGLTKELLTELGDRMFKAPEFSPAPFVTNEKHLLFPNPIFSTTLYQNERTRKTYRFLGQIVGKSLYEGVLLDVEFARFFLQKWTGELAAKNSFDDLYYLDPELYSSLVAVYSYDGDVEELGLDFTTTNAAGETVNLKRNGAAIAVTNKNSLEYIHALANYRLNTSLAPQTRWFLSGLTELIPLQWLRMFNPHEIQMLLSGGTSVIDIEDLQRNTIVNGFPASSKTVENFWKVVRSMTEEQRHKLIQFVTSTPKAPLLGFSQLSPKFCVRCSTHIYGEHDVLAYLSPDEIERRSKQSPFDDGRLPTASTCVNLLKLPNYSSIEVLRERLLFAIESNAGFDLS